MRVRSSYAPRQPARRCGPPTSGERSDTQRFRGPGAPSLSLAQDELSGRLIETAIASRHLGEQRSITVYLPPDPADGPLPAVFMADGAATDSFARVAEPLIVSGAVRPVAIVGVHAGGYEGDPSGRADSAGGRRAREYLPFEDRPTFTAHKAFWLEEVLPWAARTYDVSADRSDRAVLGYSNGGVFALSVALEHPDVFAYALPFSIGVALPTRPAPEARLPRFFFVAGELEPPFEWATCSAHGAIRSAGGESSFETYNSGHDLLLWQTAFARKLPLVFPR